VLGLNALFYVAFGVGAWLAALVTATGRWGDASLALVLPWLVLVPLCGAAALLATRRPLEPGGPFARRALVSGIAALAWVAEVLGDRGGRRMVVATVLYWLGNIACLWAALHSVGETLPFPELLLAFAVGHAAMLLPLPFGGIGGVDAALTYALTAVGVPLAPALVAVGVYRLFAFWAPTIPALAALVTLPRTGRRLSALSTT
jgi:putative heme transporter